MFTRYIDEVVDAARAITVINKDSFRRSLVSLSQTHTSQADMEFDKHGKVIKQTHVGNNYGLADTVVVEQDAPRPEPQGLFEDSDSSKKVIAKKTKKRKR